jgi:hypothetical protein
VNDLPLSAFACDGGGTDGGLYNPEEQCVEEYLAWTAVCNP